MERSLRGDCPARRLAAGGGGGAHSATRTLDVYNVFNKQAEVTEIEEFSSNLSGNNLILQVLVHQL